MTTLQTDSYIWQHGQEYDPPKVKIFQDEIVMAQANGICDICGQTLEAGDTIHLIIGHEDGERFVLRRCPNH